MASIQFILESTRVVQSDRMGPAAIVIDGETIGAIQPHAGSSSSSSSRDVLDVGDSVIMPGLVDTHVHINEPGRTEWEGFATGSRASAAGGVTTIIDMPLNSSPVTTTPAALELKRVAAERSCLVDFGFWAGLTPDNLDQIDALLDAGALGFKCFLVPSGIDDFPHVTERELRLAMPILARRGATLLVHAESPEHLLPIAIPTNGSHQRSYRSFLDSRPPICECKAIQMMIRLCAEFQCAVHIVHLSASEALPMIADAKRRGLRFSVETCPHYLALCADDIPVGATQFKCTPPIRDRANNDRLWKGLDDGMIDMVASDHSPCLPALKCLDTGDFAAAWGGIASLQLSLPIMWTQMRRRGHSILQLIQWMSARPAQLAGLTRKGAIAPGHDADLVIWNPEKSIVVNESMLQHRHKITPYLGRQLQGEVEMTYVRGQSVFNRGDFPLQSSGRWIRRGGS